jgi:predicted ATP-binding protein involved in virulence
VNGSGKTTVVDAVTKAMRVFAERVQRPDSSLSEFISTFYMPSDIREGTNSSGLSIEMQFKENDKVSYLNIDTNNHLKDAKAVETNGNKDRRGGDGQENISPLQLLKNEFDTVVSELSDKAKKEEEEYRIQFSDDLEKFEEKRKEINETLGDTIKKHEDEYYKKRDELLNDALNENPSLKWNIRIIRDAAKDAAHSDLTLIENIGLRIDSLRYYSKPPVRVAIPALVSYPCANATPLLLNGKRQIQQSNIFDTYHQAFDGNPVSLESLMYWYRAEEGNARELGKSSMLKSVQKSIYDFLNDENGRFDNLRISFLDDPDGELVIDKNGTKLRIAQLSSGERMLFLLVADLARRIAIATPGSKDPCKEGTGIVLVDEIDLHLHPKWQRNVIPKLMELFPKVQFVVTTHSAVVLTHLDQVISIENAANQGDACKVYQLIKDETSNMGKVSELKHYGGSTLQDFFYDNYGLTKRSPVTQKELDRLFDMIDDSSDPITIDLYKQLKERLGENDPAILDAEAYMNV